MIHVRLSMRILLTLICVLFSAQATAATSERSILWGGCGITKKAFMAELAKAYEKKTGIKVNLQGGGATKGIREANGGQIDIGGACRAKMNGSAEERNAYQVPVAWDALVVIVHPENPVDSITFEQLQDLYDGRITSWAQLGGEDKPVNLYIRRGKISGVGRTLRELVFADYEKDFKNPYKVTRSSGPLEKGIMQNKYGIGTTGISSAKRRNVKILKLNGKEPNFEHIKNGEYVLYRPLYLVTKQKSQSDQKVKDFITFALSPEGRQIIRNAGTVPYADAIGLVMKQVEQYERATRRGLYK